MHSRKEGVAPGPVGPQGAMGASACTRRGCQPRSSSVRRGGLVQLGPEKCDLAQMKGVVLREKRDQPQPGAITQREAVHTVFPQVICSERPENSRRAYRPAVRHAELACTTLAWRPVPVKRSTMGTSLHGSRSG